MNITFEAIGLSFNAEVEYTPIIPGRYSGPPEDCYPDDGGELVFVSLTHDNKDAMFLIDSTVSEELYEAAGVEAESTIRSEAEQAQIDRYESRNHE